MADTQIVFDLKADTSGVDSALSMVKEEMAETIGKTREMAEGFKNVEKAIELEKTPIKEINGLLHRQLERAKENKDEIKEQKAYEKELFEQMKENFEQAEKLFDKLREQKDEQKEIYEQEKRKREEEKEAYAQEEKLFDKMKEQKDELKEQNEKIRIQKDDIKEELGAYNKLKDKNIQLKDEMKEQNGKLKEQLSFEEKIKKVNGQIYDVFKEQNDRIKWQNQEIDFNERIYKNIWGANQKISTAMDGIWKGTRSWKIESEEVEKKYGRIYADFKDLKALNTWGELAEKMKILFSKFTTLDEKILGVKEAFKILEEKGKVAFEGIKSAITTTKEKFTLLKDKAKSVASSIKESFSRVGSSVKGAMSKIKGIGSKIGGMGSKVSGLFNKAAIGVTMAAATGGVAVNQMVDQQSKYTEALNATGQIFGKNSDKMKKWADTHTATTGQSKAELMEGNAQLGAMLKGMGMNQEKTAQYSTQMTQMGADLGSFFNKSNEDVSASIKSIITGETETMKDNFGIVMTQQNLQAFARQEHYKKDYKAMTQQEQVELRLAYVRKSSSSAMGDYSRSLSSSLENQKKLVMANLNNIATDAGKALLPIGLALTQLMMKMMPYFTKMANGLAGIVKNTVNWFTKTKEGQAFVKNISSLFSALWKSGNSGIGVIGKGFSTVLSYIGNMIGGITNFFTKTDEGGRMMENVVKVISLTWDALTKVIMPIFATALKVAGGLVNNILNMLTGQTNEQRKYNGLVDKANQSHKDLISKQKELKKHQQDLNKLKKEGLGHSKAAQELAKKIKEEQKQVNDKTKIYNQDLKTANDYKGKHNQAIKDGNQDQKEMNKMWEGIVKSFQNALGQVGKVVGKIGDAIEHTKLFKGLIKVVGDIFKTLFDLVGPIATFIGNIATTLIQIADYILTPIIMPIVNFIWGIIKDVANLIGGIVKAFNAVGGWLAGLFGGGGHKGGNKHANGGELEDGDIWGETNQPEMMVRGNQGNGEVMNLTQIQNAIEKGMRNVNGGNGGNHNGQPIIVNLEGNEVFNSTLKKYANNYGAW